MIVVDTNVLAAVAGKAPPIQVVAWLDHQPPRSIWTTTITVFELYSSVERLRSADRMTRKVDQLLDEYIGGRVLPFDTAAAREAARISDPLDVRDLQIAGIALHHKAAGATRYSQRFPGSCTCINPWDL